MKFILIFISVASVVFGSDLFGEEKEMNMKSLQIPLKFESASQYLIEELRDGNTLAQSLLQYLLLDNGRYLALLHPSANKNLVYSFRSGGILPQNPLEPVTFRGKIYPGRRRANSYQELVTYLENAMSSKTCCYFDDQMHRREDSIAQKYKEETLYYNGELYLFLQGEKFSIERSEKMVRYTNAQWYYMNVISEEGPGTNHEISIEKLQMIASRTTHIVVGAYDGEGYLIWQKG